MHIPMNPIIIALLVVAGMFGYIFGGIGTWHFLKNIRNWKSYQLEDRGIWASVVWPLIMIFYLFLYIGKVVGWLAKLPFRPLKVRAARIKRSGKNYRGEIVK